MNGEKLIEIARATGLRELMHGIPPSVARAALERFMAAVDAERAASRVEIVVECDSEILSKSTFWRGSPERIDEIRNIPARHTAQDVARDGKARTCGMWRVRVERGGSAS